MNLILQLLIGNMDQKDYTLKIREKIKEDPTQMILYLLHEYSHAISQKKFKTADYRTSEQELIEEGMADTFADIVARSFYEQNGVITINGQKIDLKEATILNYSGYENHNNVVRTMLYPLEDFGQDTEAIFNYYFDNKLKFYELTLGTDYVEKLPNNFNKNPNFVDFSWDEIYNNHTDGYKEINSESVYAINNKKLNEFCERYNTEIENGKKNTQNFQNNVEENNEIKDDLVDYYERYGIDKNEKWETIKEKLKKEQIKWLKRSSSTNEKTVLDEIFQYINEISTALTLFKPGNEDKRKKYDLELEQQKKREIIKNDNKEGAIIKNNRICLNSIAASIRKNPISLEHLKDVQRQMANQIKQRQISKEHLQVNTIDFVGSEDLEK